MLGKLIRYDGRLQMKFLADFMRLWEWLHLFLQY